MKNIRFILEIFDKYQNIKNVAIFGYLWVVRTHSESMASLT